MLTARMMSKLPTWINNWSFAHLDDTVAGGEANFTARLDKIDMRPLIPVIMNIVSYLTKQGSLRQHHTPCLTHEARIGMGKSITMFLRRARAKPKASMKVFGLILTLVWNVRRVVNDHIEHCRPKRHLRVIAYDRGAMLWINVQTNHVAVATAPKACAIY